MDFARHLALVKNILYFAGLFAQLVSYFDTDSGSLLAFMAFKTSVLSVHSFHTDSSMSLLVFIAFKTYRLLYGLVSVHSFHTDCSASLLVFISFIQLSSFAPKSCILVYKEMHLNLVVPLILLRILKRSYLLEIW